MICSKQIIVYYHHWYVLARTILQPFETNASVIYGTLSLLTTRYLFQEVIADAVNYDSQVLKLHLVI